MYGEYQRKMELFQEDKNYVKIVYVKQEAGLVHRTLDSSEDNFHLNRDLNGNKADQDQDKVLHKDLSNGIKIAIQ